MLSTHRGGVPPGLATLETLLTEYLTFRDRDEQRERCKGANPVYRDLCSLVDFHAAQPSHAMPAMYGSRLFGAAQAPPARVGSTAQQQQQQHIVLPADDLAGPSHAALAAPQAHLPAEQQAHPPQTSPGNQPAADAVVGRVTPGRQNHTTRKGAQPKRKRRLDESLNAGLGAQPGDMLQMQINDEAFMDLLFSEDGLVREQFIGPLQLVQL